jgi:hypothetical protein
MSISQMILYICILDATINFNSRRKSAPGFLYLYSVILIVPAYLVRICSST